MKQEVILLVEPNKAMREALEAKLQEEHPQAQVLSTETLYDQKFEEVIKAERIYISAKQMMLDKIMLERCKEINNDTVIVALSVEASNLSDAQQLALADHYMMKDDFLLGDQ